MTRAEIRAVHPAMPSRDVSASLTFDVDRLGFQNGLTFHRDLD